MKEFISITSWLQDSSFNIYPTNKGDGKYHMLPTGELMIRLLEEADVYRSYQCRAINRLTGHSLLSVHRIRFTVTDSLVQVAPRILESSVSVHVKKDQTVVLPCFAQGNPPPSYVWRKEGSNGDMEIRLGGRIGSAQEVLLIERVELNDAGVWTCIVNNSVGHQKKSTTLHVAVPLSVILQPSGQVVVDVGEHFEMKCVVNGGQNPSITWLKDANPIITSNSPRPGDGGKLEIAKVGREDAGMYQCLVRDEEGSLQSSVQLILGASKPQFLYKFIQQTVQPGPAMSLKCIATGNPTPHITWTIDGFPLPQNERFVIGQYVTLHGDVISHVNISNVHVQDGGIYQCTASNRVGEVTHSAEMRVYGLPYIRSMPNISAVAGEPLYISCPVAGYPIDLITWEKEGRKLPLNRRHRVFNNGTLHIITVERGQDEGSYRCTAQNKQGKAASQVVHLSIIVPPKLGPFTFGELIEGVRTQVQCVVQAGDPPLTLQWFKDEMRITSGLGIHISKDDYSSTLAIGRVGLEHAGDYTCVATNPAKSTKLSSKLIVSVPPRWISEPKDLNVTRDGVARFDCIAEGFPTPQTTWKKIIGQHPNEYQDLNIGRHGFSLYDNGTLVIKPTLSEHEGQYLCEAANGIGSGISSTVTLNVNNPPEFDVLSTQESVRRGQTQILTCEAHGDSPLSITWTKHSSSQLNARYEVREKQVRGGLFSELIIENSVKSDSGQYACIATNPYGTTQRTILLQVQDAPGKPLDVRVLDITSRSMKISWLPPVDEQSSTLQYSVQYKRLIMDEWETFNAGNENQVTITNLQPASVYSIRIHAENLLGAGEPSDITQVTTHMEAPSGEPQGLTVTTTSSTELTASWLPPPTHTHNGELLGYYVGIREYGGGPAMAFNFTTVNALPNGVSVLLNGLRPYGKYGIVVQAFNHKGPGPMTAETIAHTLEDVPSAPPTNIQCSSQNSQSILVSWKPPPLGSQNGRIQGYRIYYENMAEYPPGYIEAETKLSTETTAKINGLQKYSNYSMEVWAFTKVGDGVKSKPIFCITDEDVPEAPTNIKVLSTSLTSLTVSWTRPNKPNGKITSYTVYWRTLEGGKGRDPEKKRVPPTQTFYQIAQLSKSGTYELWVAASTRIGEGHHTHVVYATPSNRGAAGIISFGGIYSVRLGENIELPCLMRGQPTPSRIWLPKSLPYNIQLRPDGTLIITAVQKIHQKNYTCSVTNPSGTDEITYSLKVIVPPEPPAVTVTGNGPEWIEINWNIVDTGGSAIRGYLLEHAPVSSQMLQWNEERLPRDKFSYRLNSLSCGTQYNLRMCAYNSAGTGETSRVLTSRTEGGKPAKPSFRDFIRGNVSSVTLNLNTWNNNGCPILSFNIEYKEVTHSDWLTVGKDIQGKDIFDIVGLWPGKRYKIRVKAENSAGVTTAEYSFTTLHNLGVTLSPTSVKILSEDNSVYLEPGVILPIVASVLTLISIGVAVTICFRRKRNCVTRPRHQQTTQTMVALDNKSNLAQREQYYAAVHKGMSTPVHELQCENIPEYPDDISPYATFHVATQQVSTPQHMRSFIYHDQALASMETMPLKSGNLKEEYQKIRSNSKLNKCMSACSDYSGSTTDQWSEQGASVVRPERIPLQMYGGSLPAGESSTSPEQSPVHERRIPIRHKHSSNRKEASFGFPGRLEPPSGFTDGIEISEAECDMESIHRIKGKPKGMRNKRDRRSRFTIAV
ncbi:Down syndrome cell adhesion molecule-like protein Dscam2 isoform X2 [Cimex lectularius]|uniref:Down syndrome cell adhesion molecule-like protein Dscam2 n=1 Tax=Cimex lectularius TaxID=79782 RepID=A0A8I6SJ97_CIMLE|nr:Down syndrome cell adhesion molecule-like protein Dscam2 isoform X2 [Cimex lectularius]